MFTFTLNHYHNTVDMTIWSDSHDIGHPTVMFYASFHLEVFFSLGTSCQQIITEAANYFQPLHGDDKECNGKSIKGYFRQSHRFSSIFREVVDPDIRQVILPLHLPNHWQTHILPTSTLPHSPALCHFWLRISRLE